MKLSGLHILLTYQCTFECDHCFVWGSPWQTGTLSLAQIREILDQAREADVSWVFFEGGEPFLYYPILLCGVQIAHEAGFQVGIVSNAYWAHTVEDATEWLKPFVGLIQDLSISSDLYHYNEMMSLQAKNAVAAAGELSIPIGVISVCQPEYTDAEQITGILSGEGAAVMYRGRATEKLVPRAALHGWQQFTECPHEDLRDPGRAHLDPLGNLHICQGLVIGNLFEKPLKDICTSYDPDSHPVVGPLLNGGPVALVQEYALPHADAYADACHLCYESRRALRELFPQVICPDQVFGKY